MYRIIVATGLALLSGAAPGQNGSSICPADRAKLEGSSSTSYPLGRCDSRYQQLFGGLTQSRLLRGQAYRRDALSTRGEIKAYKTSMAIRLSSTALAPAKASRTFASNAGSATTQVLGPTLVSFPTTPKPTTIPAAFSLRIPYATPYSWGGKGTLCMDMTIDGNQLSTGNNKTFAPSLDAQELYSSGRNLQPGYRFGAGCPAPGQKNAAYASFELRHLGSALDLYVSSRYGVPSTSAAPAQSVLLLSLTRVTVPWPPGSGCSLYGKPLALIPLPGNNTSAGAWTGTLPAGAPPPAMTEMVAQILSLAPASGALALADASRLIAPPAGSGVVSSRIVSASDRKAATGTVSFTVTVTEFY